MAPGWRPNAPWLGLAAPCRHSNTCVYRNKLGISYDTSIVTGPDNAERPKLGAGRVGMGWGKCRGSPELGAEPGSISGTGQRLSVVAKWFCKSPGREKPFRNYRQSQQVSQSIQPVLGPTHASFVPHLSPIPADFDWFGAISPPLPLRDNHPGTVQTQGK